MSLTINSFGNNAISSLFNTSSNNTYGIFGGLEGSLTDLAQIKSGSYGKLIKSYYSKFDSEGNIKDSSEKASKIASSNLSEVRGDSSELSKATDALLKKDDDSIWDKKETTDDEGNVTSDYDRDAIYKAVSDFASAYNDLVDSGQETDNTGILTQVAGMVTTSAKAASTLGKAGITIDTNNHLQVNEDFLKNKADMTYVKDLFSGVGSYAYQIATKSSMVNSYANSELSSITGLKSYNNSGNYALSTADMINSFNTTT